MNDFVNHYKEVRDLIDCEIPEVSTLISKVFSVFNLIKAPVIKKKSLSINLQSSFKPKTQNSVIS